MIHKALLAAALAVGLYTPAQAAPVLDLTGLEVSLTTSSFTNNIVVPGPVGPAIIGSGVEFNVGISADGGAPTPFSIDIDPSGTFTFLASDSIFANGGGQSFSLSFIFEFTDPALSIVGASNQSGGGRFTSAVTQTDPLTFTLFSVFEGLVFPGGVVSGLNVFQITPSTILGAAIEVDRAAIPAPGAASLFLVGLGGLAWARRRRA